MGLDKEPFRMYQSEEQIAEQKKKSWTISVRVNEEEQALIKQAKQDLHLKTDSTALKILARVGLNVLHNSFSADILRYLTDPSRRREEK